MDLWHIINATLSSTFPQATVPGKPLGRFQAWMNNQTHSPYQTIIRVRDREGYSEIYDTDAMFSCRLHAIQAIKAMYLSTNLPPLYSCRVPTLRSTLFFSFEFAHVTHSSLFPAQSSRAQVRYIGASFHAVPSRPILKSRGHVGYVR